MTHASVRRKFEVVSKAMGCFQFYSANWQKDDDESLANADSRCDVSVGKSPVLIPFGLFDI